MQIKDKNVTWVHVNGIKTMQIIISYICHNVNLPDIASKTWKYDYFIITDHFHFPQFQLVEKSQ
jgi:hypothetical protein